MSDPRQDAQRRLEQLINGHWLPVSNALSAPEPLSLVRRRQFLRGVFFGALGCAAIGQSALANCLLMPTGAGGGHCPTTSCPTIVTVTETQTRTVPSSPGGDQSASGTGTTTATGSGSTSTANTTSGVSYTVFNPGPPPISQTVIIGFGGGVTAGIEGSTAWDAGAATTGITLGSYPSHSETLTLIAEYETTTSCPMGCGHAMAEIESQATPVEMARGVLPGQIEELVLGGPYWRVEFGM